MLELRFHEVKSTPISITATRLNAKAQGRGPPRTLGLRRPESFTLKAFNRIRKSNDLCNAFSVRRFSFHHPRVREDRDPGLRNLTVSR